MLDHKNISDVIIQLENNNDVNILNYSEIKIWPLLRLAIYQKRYTDSEFINYNSKRSINISRAYKIIREKIIRNYNIINNQHLGNTDVVFLSRQENYTVNIKGKLFDKHIDSIIAKINKDFKCQKLEMFSKNDFFKKKHYTPYYLHGLSDNMNYSLLEVFDKLTKNELININKCLYELTEKKISLKWFWYYVQLTKLFSDYFIDILKRVSPKIAFVTCYYSPINMGFVHACKKLNIISVDLQHGQQSIFHPMYKRWTKEPSEGYDLLPDKLWVWREQDPADLINNNKYSDRMASIVGGNQFISLYLNRPDMFDKKSYLAFRTKLSSFKKVILVVCSNEYIFNDLIHENVYELMKEKNNHWFWLIRLHPLSPKKYYFLMGKKLSKMGINNFDINISNKCNLISLITKTDVLITNNSSTCVESLEFNLCRIVVHETGEKLYNDLIINNLIYYADTILKIKKLINITARKPNNEYENIIKNENDKFNYAINKLLA